ncbi:MAG: deoxyribodipyrimidine photo-lyase [Isosphaeraceae bacterium]
MPRVETVLKTNPRLRVVSGGETDPNGRAVVYWMQRAQRGRENPALDTAVELGVALGLPVLAVFGLTADYPGAQRRHYRFLVDAMPEIAEETRARGVPLVVRLGQPDEVALAVATEARAAVVVGDENPLRVGKLWRERFARSARVPFVCVDADVVVPTALFPKEEYAARTIRPKIHKVLHSYLKPSPNRPAKHAWQDAAIPKGEPIEPNGLLERLKVGGVPEVPGYRGGPKEAMRRLGRFVKERLSHYGESRNEPIPYTTSELSAHLHFGHISPLTAVLAASDSGASPEAVDVFVEELVVRRELAVNFVARNPDYDTLAGCPSWARETLARHAKDPRPVLYDPETLEAGTTHDPLWNAAQLEMVATGRMHNYLRMYWAKRVLEWTPDAETAFRILVDLNDRYEMDGRDPNGYTGVAWAIGGSTTAPGPSGRSSARCAR